MEYWHLCMLSNLGESERTIFDKVFRIYGIFISVVSSTGAYVLYGSLWCSQHQRNGPLPWISHLSELLIENMRYWKLVCQPVNNWQSLECVVAILYSCYWLLPFSRPFNSTSLTPWCYDRTWWPLNTTEPTVHKSKFAAEWENVQVYRSIAAASSVHCSSVK